MDTNKYAAIEESMKPKPSGFRKNIMALAVASAIQQLLDEAHHRAWYEERRRRSIETGIRLTEKTQ